MIVSTILEYKFNLLSFNMHQLALKVNYDIAIDIEDFNKSCVIVENSEYLF